MNIKYFDDANGRWADVTGNIGDTLVIDASGFTTAPPKPYKSLVILNLTCDEYDNVGFDIVENDFDTTFDIVVTSGLFTLTADSGAPFTDGKTGVFKATSYDDSTYWFSFNHKFINESQIDFIHAKYGTPEGYSTMLINATIEIRVYP